jgi:NTP pyrophosphatase (non-canonical NTP hydrolase)
MNKLIRELRKFARDRDWEKFHSPKNLSMALAVEAAEIMEQFQWLTEEQSRNLDKKTLKRIKKEIGDVQIYLARLADQLGFSPVEAAIAKIKENRKKYPVKKARGVAIKYADFAK